MNNEGEQQAENTVRFPAPSKLVNKKFEFLWKDKSRYILCYGGRNSSKSFSIARHLITRCITDDYFKAILIRKTYASIKDSMFETIVEDIEKMGLSDLFKITRSPLEINCKNGNKFLCRGLDGAEKIKSISQPNIAWYEEAAEIDNITDWLTVSTSLRSNKTKVLQEYFSFNPEFKADYESHWLYQTFFHGQEVQNKSFDGILKSKLDSGEIIENTYSVHHSTYLDNKYVTKQQEADLLSLKEINPYYYTVFALGEFGMPNVTNRFWKDFDKLKHVEKLEFDVASLVHCSFDVNVAPFSSMQIFQTKVDGDKTTIKLVHEICLRSPNNKLISVAKEIKRYLRKNKYELGRIMLYGDLSSMHENTLLKTGVNYFSMMESELSDEFKVIICRDGKQNPGISISADFINSVFSSNFDDLEIKINETCIESINDFIMLQETTEGKTKKVKVDGVELLGHTSDSFRYFLCTCFKDNFKKYKGRIGGGNTPVFFTYEQQQAESPFYY